MVGRQAKRDQPDRSKIDMCDDLQVKYWTKHFEVSREQLQEAVDKVGNSAATVKKQLGLNPVNRDDGAGANAALLPAVRTRGRCSQL
jgi:hypothetical protein